MLPSAGGAAAPSRRDAAQLGCSGSRCGRRSRGTRAGSSSRRLSEPALKRVRREAQRKTKPAAFLPSFSWTPAAVVELHRRHAGGKRLRIELQTNTGCVPHSQSELHLLLLSMREQRKGCCVCLAKIPQGIWSTGHVMSQLPGRKSNPPIKDPVKTSLLCYSCCFLLSQPIRHCLKLQHAPETEGCSAVLETHLTLPNVQRSWHRTAGLPPSPSRATGPDKAVPLP